MKLTEKWHGGGKAAEDATGHTFDYLSKCHWRNIKLQNRIPSHHHHNTIAHHLSLYSLICHIPSVILLWAITQPTLSI